MIWTNHGLHFALLMEAFPDKKSRAVEIIEVAKEVLELRKVLADLTNKLETKFPHIKLYPLEEVEILNHRIYPHIYYAAVRYEINIKNLTENYSMSQIATIVAKTIIHQTLMKKAIQKTNSIYLVILRKKENKKVTVS